MINYFLKFEIGIKNQMLVHVCTYTTKTINDIRIMNICKLDCKNVPEKKDFKKLNTQCCLVKKETSLAKIKYYKCIHIASGKTKIIQ